MSHGNAQTASTSLQLSVESKLICSAAHNVPEDNMITIDNEPLAFNLWGLSGEVPNEQYGEVGMRLMNQMWQQLRTNNIRNAGTNHWVYQEGGRMFVGVELQDSGSTPAGFENIQFRLDRYLRYLHIGAYQLLPAVWQTLLSELQLRGERISSPSLEVYGHQSPNASTPPETTIIIALESH